MGSSDLSYNARALVFRVAPQYDCFTKSWKLMLLLKGCLMTKLPKMVCIVSKSLMICSLVYIKIIELVA